MIHLILGNQGSGKTLFLVKKAYEFYCKNYNIYSNIDLKFKYKPLDYNDIINCRLSNGAVFLDEIHLLLPSRNCMKKSSREICDNFLSMVRKKNLEVFGSTQKIRKVDIRFREEADFIYMCTKWNYDNHLKRWKEITHNQNLDVKEPVMIKIVVFETFSQKSIEYKFLGNKYFFMYDTKQIIKVRGLKNDK